MDFTKFVDVLSTSTLFFSRSDKLGDPFEGAVPRAQIDRLTRHGSIVSPKFKQEVAMYAELGMEFRKYVFVNCWHRNEHESAALWNLYLKSDEGVAILSTNQRLQAVSDRKHHPWVVPVWYIDYVKDNPPVPTRMAPFRYKRKSFEHEKEIRLIWFAQTKGKHGKRLPPPAEDGVRVKVDLNKLVKAVYVSPTSPKWFRELTKSVCRSFGLKKQVRQSSLSIDTPMFA
jgi:hypothetical protein